MPGKHKNDTIAFRPSPWAKEIINQRAALSGLYKKDFITRSCIYSNIVVVGTAENIQRIVDSLQEMQDIMKEVSKQLKSDNLTLSKKGCRELKTDLLSLVITAVDIIDGAAYLFNKSPPDNPRDWKSELELEQYRNVLEQEQDKLKKE